MSHLIQILPDHIANQIAAGEVIQRPASVVKELVENSIDAGATRIDVIIKDAGKTLIQIIDNGSGMTLEDAKLCFARHATSKVRKADDLFALTTKGFRGEALASIAAIAHVTLNTKKVDSPTGTSVQIEGSEIKNCEETVCSDGTSFEVKNLFFNVPARRNFLKSSDVEFKHIKDEFERIVLAHPNVHFSLVHNGTEIYNLHNAVLRKRIIDLIGDRQNERLVPIEESTDIVQIKGYVVKPEFAKKTRGDQFLFVNDRFFKDGYFNHAINKAFEGMVQPKHHPGYYLYFEIDPSKIDVNVHPTKTEIKFEEDRLIYAILVSSIRQALGKYNIAPTLDFERETSFDIPAEMRKQTPVEPTIAVNPDYNPFKTASSASSKGYTSSGMSKAIQSEGFGSASYDSKDWQNFYSIEEENEEEINSSAIDFKDETPSIGQLIIKSPYIIAQIEDELIVINGKRAFERITYDKMMQEFIQHPLNSQALLFPIEKELSSTEIELWNQNKELLQRIGFEGKTKNDQLFLAAVPSVLQEEGIHQCIDSILETLQHKDLDKSDITHNFVQSIAYNASQKKDLLSIKENVIELIDQLLKSEENQWTPNGKKIIVPFDFNRITKEF